MGASGKWVKALFGLNNKKDIGGKKKKWRLWKSSSLSENRSQDYDYASVASDSFSSAVATVVRAPLKNFKLIKQEWAATRIQAVFRSFLAKMALRALKGVVMLQALVRARLVRRQVADTLRCMQALVRVQARVRARRVRMSIEGQAVQNMLNKRRSKDELIKQAEKGWCDVKGSLEDVKTKLQMRQEGASKRERAIAYSLAQKQLRSTPVSNAQANTSRSNHKVDKAAKPWESRLMEQTHHANAIEKKCVHSSNSKTFEPCNVKVRKNNVTTRVSARPPPFIG